MASEVQPDLFGEVAAEPSTEWQEVPQARFLSWTDAEQLAYCAARDYDAAADEHVNEWWCQFYLKRAEGYRS